MLGLLLSQTVTDFSESAPHQAASVGASAQCHGFVTVNAGKQHTGIDGECSSVRAELYLATIIPWLLC